ncbi:RNA ligase 1 family protein [Streptacidiphilus carbonis]|jgi:hypothetical protein|uniref:RNA ligase 1 family protein n=1 Tax=Streptacidiphilus carbonis TaxID=105422 RepID=UPI0005A64F22|nr:DUF5565 family protein [Streptacidiphilus carbonis]
MQKIPTVFVRDFSARPAYVTEQPDPRCRWVLDGEGTPTRKYDGACTALDADGRWWARREVKAGGTPPPDYLPLHTDEETGKTVGWEPIEQSGFARWHAEAVAHSDLAPGSEGTFELIGPKVNGNPERSEVHRLVAHDTAERLDVPDRSFAGIRETVLALAAADGCEGIVFHHSDGRKAKIKARDFGPADPF